MVKRSRRMSNSDINTIVADLNRWALGELGSKLTWAVLVGRFGFSRQSLQAKPEIKAAYLSAKQALSGGIVKTKQQATEEVANLRVEVASLKLELDIYKNKEQKWLKRWQKIAFHIRQRGIQMSNVDKILIDDSNLPSNTETAKILKPFDKDLPPSGRL